MQNIKLNHTVEGEAEWQTVWLTDQQKTIQINLQSFRLARSFNSGPEENNTTLFRLPQSKYNPRLFLNTVSKF